MKSLAEQGIDRFAANTSFAIKTEAVSVQKIKAATLDDTVASHLGAQGFSVRHRGKGC